VSHSGAEEDVPGVKTKGQATVSLAMQVSRVLREAWLHVLQTHPSRLPCASVLCYDDVLALKRALHPRTCADLHAVLSNPTPWMVSIQKGVPSLLLTVKVVQGGRCVLQCCADIL
jgi:hypothetical protein